MNEIRKATCPEEQCEFVIPKVGQCPNARMPDTRYCPPHGGDRATASLEAEGLRNYRISIFQARLAQLGSSSDIKSLRDEIGILRLLVEQEFARIDGATSLLQHSHRIQDLIMKINTVVTSCHKLEGSMGRLVDHQAIINFADQVINLLNEHIEDPVILESLASGILRIVGSIGSDDDA